MNASKRSGRIYSAGGSNRGVGIHDDLATVDYLPEGGAKVVLVECDTSRTPTFGRHTESEPRQTRRPRRDRRSLTEPAGRLNHISAYEIEEHVARTVVAILGMGRGPSPPSIARLMRIRAAVGGKCREAASPSSSTKRDFLLMRIKESRCEHRRSIEFAKHLRRGARLTQVPPHPSIAFRRRVRRVITAPPEGRLEFRVGSTDICGTAAAARSRTEPVQVRRLRTRPTIDVHR
jgi:hypothetical protein